jgi:hypothetical protein
MSVPLRKDRPEEELSTSDLAQRKPPSATEEGRLKPVLSETNRMEAAEASGPEVREPTDATPLFPDDELEGLRGRWTAIQGTFVDEPRSAVEQADALVASAMQRLAEVFSDERSKLEKQWDQGDNVSTEDLRLALQRYRSFFHRLLSV